MCYCKFTTSFFKKLNKTPVVFVQAYSNFGDIIRHTMGKCREIHTKAFARVLLLSLQQEFEKLMDDSEGDIDSGSKEFATIKVCQLLNYKEAAGSRGQCTGLVIQGVPR